MKSFSRLFFFFVLFLPLFTRADAFSLMENSEWMESIQLIEGEWIEGATDLATENLQLSRLFTTVERSNRRLAEGWQFNLPGLLEQDMPRRPFLHPLKKHIKLRYDEKNRLVKLETEAPLSYESIEIFYEEGDRPCCRALSHLGDLVEYAMESSEGNNLCLSSVKKSGSPEIRYRYKKHPTERKLLLTERTVEGVETLLFEYTKDGKLRSVYRNSKDHLLFSLEYLQQKTRVSFPSGVVQEYSFNASKHVTRIDTIVSSSLYKTQTFEWKNGKISEKATLDGEGKTLIKESFDFDSQGHLIREAIAGINSDPYSKEYVYDAENRLIEEREASGKNKRYIYTGSSQAASEIHVLNGDEQIERTFYTYSPLGKITMELHDYGEGTLTTFQNLSQFDENGCIVEKAKGFIDPLTNEREVEETEYFTYDNRQRLTSHLILNALGNCLEESYFTYDAFGHCITSKNQNIQTTFEYTDTGRLIKKLEEAQNYKKITEYRPDGKLLKEEEWKAGFLPQSCHYIYDQMERLVKKIDQFGNETEFIFDVLGRKIAEKAPYVLDPEGKEVRPTTLYQYDEMDRIIGLTDANGHKTSTQYNCKGQPVAILHADSTYETFSYTTDGRICFSRSREGITTLQTRDLQDQLLEETKLDRTGCFLESSQYRYSGLQLVSESHSNGITIDYTYDFRGRKVREKEHGTSLETLFVYNSLGSLVQKLQGFEGNWVISQWNEEENKWQLEDTQGNVLIEIPTQTVSEAPLETETILWSTSGRPQLMKERVDPSGITIRCVHDALGRIIREEKLSMQGEPLIVKELSYDLTGHLAREKTLRHDATLPIETKWEWGPCGRLEKVIEQHELPNQETTSYAYDDFGQLQKIVKPDGVAIEQEFNPQGTLSRIYASDLSIDYRLYYNSHGQIERIHNAIDQKEQLRNYTEEGYLQSEKLENGAIISYEYDDLGRKTKLILPDGSYIQYQYDLTFLKEVCRCSSAGEILYTHTFSAYNKEGKPIQQKMIGGLGTILDESSLSSLERKRTSPYQQETFSYDHQKRLIHKLKCDAFGEQLSSYSYNGLSELQQEECKRPETAQFDLNGNLISKRDGDTIYHYEYDALNRLKRLYRSGELIEEYHYDAYHRRMTTIGVDGHKTYLYDGNCEIGAKNDAGRITELRVLGAIRGSERDATLAIEIEGTPYAVLNDLQGSISKLVALNGTIAYDCDYTAFGASHTSSSSLVNSPWSYSGKRIDKESGLIYFGRRYLDPQLRHWVSKDPLGFVDGADRRAFVKNDPLNRFDHFGLSSVSERFGNMKSSIKKLFDQTGVRILHAIRKMREAVKVGIPEKLDHLAGRGFLLLMGYYKTAPDQGSYGLGESSDKVRISYINGIMTDYASLYSTLQELSNSHGGVNIHYVYRPTRGFVMDILQSFMVKLGFISPQAHALVDEWKKLICEMGGVTGGGTIIHYAHSIGAVETLRALSFLTPEEQKMIKIYAFGSPDLRETSGDAFLKHFVSVRDGVPLLDPWGFLKACIVGVDHVLFVGTLIGIPFIDHLFSTQSYQDLWRSMGRTFVDWYGSLIIP